VAIATLNLTPTTTTIATTRYAEVAVNHLNHRYRLGGAYLQGYTVAFVAIICNNLLNTDIFNKKIKK
jgi:hypothetical protein